jgi:cation transport ATPase
MANWFKEEIEHFGSRLEEAVKKAGHEFSSQRQLTKEDIEQLIRYAADVFGAALDQRIEKARDEARHLIQSQIAEIREQLTEAANEQKKATVRNASVAIGATIIVGMLSLFYNRYFHGEMNLIDIFRSFFLALVAGYGAWLIYRYTHSYFQAPRFKRNAIILGVRYFEVLKPKGALGHLLALALIVCLWLLFNYNDSITTLISIQP